MSEDGETGGLTIEMVLIGGKHRTVAEFRELASEAGRQASGDFMVECRPAA